MDPPAQLIQQAVAGKISRTDAESFCTAEGIEIGQLYNCIGLVIAKRFDAGTISYHDGDTAMNSVFSMMVEDASRFGDGFEFSEPVFSIYCAFDSGEYDHGDGEDPVERYTRPQIQGLIRT